MFNETQQISLTIDTCMVAVYIIWLGICTSLLLWTLSTEFCQTPPDSACYNFRQLRQSSTVVVSKVQSQMSLEECKSWTCIVLLGESEGSRKGIVY